jgi:O-antigen/teichoic acid export membrane protein
MSVALGVRATARSVTPSPATVGFAAQVGVSSLAARMLLHLSSLAFIGIAIRVLGLEGFGVYRIVLQVLSVAALVSHAGFAAQGARSVALMRTAGDLRAARRAISSAAVAAGALSCLIAVAVIAAAGPLGRALTDSPPSDIGALLRLGAAYVPMLAVAKVLQSGVRFGAPGAVAAQVGPAMMHYLLGTAALLVGLGLAGTVGTLVAGGALTLVGAWVALRDDLDGGSVAPPRTLSVVKPTRFMVARSGAAVASLPALAPGIFLLGLLGTEHDVGLFGVALALTAVGEMFLGLIRPVLEPVSLHLLARRESKRLEAVARSVTGLIAGWAWPLLMALVLVPEPFVWLLTGDATSTGATVVSVLAAGYLFLVPSAACEQILVAAGRGRVNQLTSVWATALYVAAGVWLVPRFGLVAMATLHGAVLALQALARVVEVWLLLGVRVFGPSILLPFWCTVTASAAVVACKWAGPSTSLTSAVALGLFVSVYALTTRAFPRVPVPAKVS